MKFRPTEKSGGLMVELSPRESQLPTTTEQSIGVLPVFHLKKILVPIDFSTCSKKALEYAVPLAEQFGADLILLHVLPSYAPMVDVVPVELESSEDANNELEALIKALPAQVSASKVLQRGEPHLEIVRVADKLASDLIILSTHGRSGLARVLMGSTASKVVSHAHCPVLVVREHEHEFVGELEAI